MDPMRPLLTTPRTLGPGRRRFPLRTLLLMVLALVAFARFWWITHHQSARPPPSVAGPQQQHPPIPVRPIAPGEQRPGERP